LPVASVWATSPAPSHGESQSPSTSPPPASPAPSDNATEKPPSADELVRTTLNQLTTLEESEEIPYPHAAIGEINRLILQIEGADPANPWLSFLYGRAFALMGRSGEAIDRLRKFIATGQGRSEWKAHRLLGDLFAEEYPRLSKPNYERALSLKPDDPHILMGLSVCAYKVGQHDEALHWAKEAVQTDGRKNAKYLAHLSRMYQNRQQWTEAEEAGLAALTLARDRAKREPGSVAATRILEAQSRMMAEILEAKIARTGASPDDYVRLADAVKSNADASHVLALHSRVNVLESGIKAQEPNPPVRLLLAYGEALETVQRLKSAIDAYERVLTIEPQNADAGARLVRLRNQPPPTASE